MTEKKEDVNMSRHTGAERLPGDPSVNEMIKRFIRVDQAGEYGAQRIYEGQLAVLGNRPIAKDLRKMADTERQHLEKFNELLVTRRVRPTALQPLWHLAGFALGAGTALLGERAAMACTVAIEEVIDEHYQKQANYLGQDESELRNTIVQTRNEELEHRDIALDEGAKDAPLYEPMRFAIKKGAKLAIWLSERI